MPKLSTVPGVNRPPPRTLFALAGSTLSKTRRSVSYYERHGGAPAYSGNQFISQAEAYTRAHDLYGAKSMTSAKLRTRVQQIRNIAEAGNAGDLVNWCNDTLAQL